MLAAYYGHTRECFADCERYFALGNVGSAASVNMSKFVGSAASAHALLCPDRSKKAFVDKRQHSLSADTGWPGACLVVVCKRKRCKSRQRERDRETGKLLASPGS